MKISLNWIKQFTDINLSTDELIDRINQRLGATEGWEDLSDKYQGVLVTKVVSCEKHPNADKLMVCKIDDGGKTDIERDSDGLIQVICGAPNVAKDMLVAWIPPGAIVPSTYTDMEPLVLDSRELRGELSNGMLASGKELDINNDHSGILEIDEPASPGDNFAQIYELEDVIVEIENKMFTNRADCFGVLGVAREIAGIQEIDFTSPDWYKDAIREVTEGDELKIELNNEIPELVPRMTLVALSNVSIKPSPIKLQSYLSRVGVKPINNVVDVTNFIAHMTAQPMHAFDYDKVAELSNSDFPRFVVRKANQGEKIDLLDGRTVEPYAEAIMICTDEKPLSIAGAMGGIGSEVNENTKKIVLETANFNLYSIRRTSMKHGIFTDAVTRFSKGQSPEQIKPVVAYALNMLEQNAGASVASEFIDDYPNKQTSVEVIVETDFINKRLGSKFSGQEIANILSRTELKTEVDGDNVRTRIPFWRSDLKEREDIVEEIGRLYGFDNLLLSLPKVSVSPSSVDANLKVVQQIGNKLAVNGANEFMTHSFVSEDLMNKTNQNLDDAYRLRNAISPELNYYRLTGLPSLISNVHVNHKLGFSEYACFELTKVHSKKELTDEDLPYERHVTSLIYSSENELSGAPYFQAKYYLNLLLNDMDANVEYEVLKSETELSNSWLNNLKELFVAERSALVRVNNKPVGLVGEFNTKVHKHFKLPKNVAGFELDNQTFIDNSDHKTYQNLSKYPSTEVDLTYETSSQVTYRKINSVLRDSLEKNEHRIELKLIDIYQPEDADLFRYTFSLKLTSFERTLTAKDTQAVIQKLDLAAAEQISAKRI